MERRRETERKVKGTDETRRRDVKGTNEINKGNEGNKLKGVLL